MAEDRNPLIVASEKGRQGALVGMEILRAGGTALDAVEQACRVVENDPQEDSVGYGGLPNILGEVELEASIIDGRTLRAGAVAGVRSYGNPIHLARQVMETLPHVLLQGHGAERLAAELGLPPAEQRTLKAMRQWQQRFEEVGIGDLNEEPLRRLAIRASRMFSGEEGLEPGTVNFLAIDRAGNLASGVSTSGLGWKYPGRVGDSALVGAGNYCDNRHGAAACTGVGELTTRAGTARSLVLYLKMGMSLHEAGQEALRDLDYLGIEPGQYANMVALTPAGAHAGFSTTPGKQYHYCTAEMAEPATVALTLLARA